MPDTREVDVNITVSPAGDISVSPDPFIVRKQQDQYVKWACTPAQQFMVEFGSDSPFYESQFSQDYPCSGIVRRNLVADPNRIYKYTVRVGDRVLDPGGGVTK